jgi:hypothetical protein
MFVWHARVRHEQCWGERKCHGRTRSPCEGRAMFHCHTACTFSGKTAGPSWLVLIFWSLRWRPAHSSFSEMSCVPLAEPIAWHAPRLGRGRVALKVAVNLCGNQAKVRREGCCLGDRSHSSNLQPVRSCECPSLLKQARLIEKPARQRTGSWKDQPPDGTQPR